jgi:AGZA family xanthine/uracil permease-like MFS transporter
VTHGYHWARRGDVNAFFGLMLDNVAVMIILFSSIVAKDRFSPEFVLTRMIPGTALGVLVGDLVYTWMAFRLARRTGRQVTAMPLGLDTPSTFGVAFLVLGPTIDAAMAAKDRHGGPEGAMTFAWGVGLLSLVLCGVFKLLCAPFGNAIRRLVPRAGLLGSLAAIALVLIAFLPMLLHGIGRVPIVGVVALVLILVTLVAHRELPFRFPGALGAVLVGVILYWGGYWLDLVPAPKAAHLSWRFEPFAMVSFYHNDADWWRRVFVETLNRLPVVVPFALATIVGGIDCTESAAAAGDEYDTRAVLLTEGAASLIAGLLGGVIQTTPYIGHPAYKKMGGAAAYTLATALFVGAVGCLGGFQAMFAVLPEAAMFPILVFVGLEITAQSFHATPTRHYPAVALAVMPALAVLVTVALGNLGVYGPPPGPTPEITQERLVIFQTLRCLSNGFLISGLLWAAALSMILDGRLRSAAAYFAAAGLLTLIGLIHSPFANDRILWPWLVRSEMERGLVAQDLPREAIERHLAALDYQTPWHWAAAYGLVALMLIGLSLTRTGEGSMDLPLEGLAHAGDAPKPDG